MGTTSSRSYTLKWKPLIRVHELVATPLPSISFDFPLVLPLVNPLPNQDGLRAFTLERDLHPFFCAFIHFGLFVENVLLLLSTYVLNH